MSIIIDPKLAYTVKDGLAVELRVRPLGFVKYVKNRLDASARAKTDNEAQRLELRGRIKAQTVCILSDGKEVSLNDDEISIMPFAVARQLKGALSDAMFPDGAGTPQVLSKGNGLTTPIHIQLGSPIKAGADKVISEVEFLASTLGALEDVLIADSDLERTVALLSLAQPVGPDMTLSSLPSWALDLISVSDGLFIMRNATAAFFETPTSSAA